MNEITRLEFELAYYDGAHYPLYHGERQNFSFTQVKELISKVQKNISCYLQKKKKERFLLK